jgi:hypothetical protein
MTKANRTLDVVADELRAAFKHEADNVIKIGSLLLEVKAKLGHGKWLPWLEKEFSMSERSANRYMKDFEFAKSVNVADLKLRVSVLHQLSECKFDPEESAAILKAAKTEWVGTKKAQEIAAALKPKPPAETNAAEASLASGDEASLPAEMNAAEASLVPNDEASSPAVPLPASLPQDADLQETFATSVLALRKLATKPSEKFVGAVSAADLEMVANFLNQVAAASKTHAG